VINLGGLAKRTLDSGRKISWPMAVGTAVCDHSLG